MPFTFSHPAIILPLAKINDKYISITALVAGSMAPDFEYFILMRMKQVHGHTLGGMLYFDLPLSILLCFLFHTAVRDALIMYSPIPLKSTLKQFYGYDFLQRFKKSWLVILYSAMIGIASHLFWDSWTHANRFFVELIPFLQEEQHIYGFRILNCEIGQLLSSLIGAIAIFFSIYSFKRKQFKKQNFTLISIYWGLVGLILLIVMSMRTISSLDELIATSISAWLIGLIGAALIMKWLKIERKIFHIESN